MLSEKAKGFRRSFDGIRSSRTFIICTVAIAVYVDLFLYGLVIPILPTLLTRRAHVTPSKLQVTLAGLLAAYNAAIVVFAPVTGYLADKWSNRKIPLLSGLFGLAGATVLFTVSKNLGLLYLARVLQGASASIVWAVGLALLVDAVGSEDIGAAMGWVSLGLCLGNTSGPLIGGVVYQRAGHYATFAVALAVIAVDVVLRCLLREPVSQVASTSSGTQVRQDSPHQLTESYAEGGESSEITEVPPSQPSDQQSGLEHRLENKFPPGTFNMLKLLRYPDMLCSLWCVFLITVVLTGLEAVIPLRVESTFGWSSQGAGLIFLSLVIPIFLSPLIGWLSDRWGSRPLSTTGLLLATVFGPLLALVRSFSIARVVLFVFFLLVIGIGVSLVMTPEMAEIAAFANSKAKDDPDAFGPRGATAQCCALMTIATAAGGVVGPIVTGAIQSTSGWTATSISIGAFAALGLISLLLKVAYERIFYQPQGEIQQRQSEAETQSEGETQDHQSMGEAQHSQSEGETDHRALQEKGTE